MKMKDVKRRCIGKGASLRPEGERCKEEVYQEGYKSITVYVT